jgi:hypothetical protein
MFTKHQHTSSSDFKKALQTQKNISNSISVICKAAKELVKLTLRYNDASKSEILKNLRLT